MTKVYLIRHAQASGNFERIFQGHTDGAVSEMGQKQLDRLAERCRELSFDVLYSSPLTRAHQTAQAANRYHDVPILLDVRLMEIDGGLFEGKPFAELPELYPEEFEKWMANPDRFHAPDGESMVQMYARISGAIDEIAKDNAGKTIGIVSHGCAIRNFLCYADSKPIDKLRYILWCDNTAVSLIEYDEDNKPRLVFANDNAHLEDDISTFAIQDWWKDMPEPESEDGGKPER